MQYTYTGSTSYNAGGDTPSVPLRNIAAAFEIGCNTAALGIEFAWNSQTGRMQLFQQNATTGPLVEFSGNASTFQFTLLFISGDN